MIKKFFMIVMGIYLVIIAGSCNIYPIYLQKMIDKFDFSLKEVNLFGTFINMGLWIAFPMGTIYDYMGPKFSLALAFILLPGSYLVLHLLLMTDYIQTMTITPFLILGIFMGQGSALCYTSGITTNLKNFRFKDSSSLVGLLVANMAISPSIFTSYRENLENDNLTGQQFFYILAIFQGTVIFLCFLFYENLTNVYSDNKNFRNYEKYKERYVIRFLIFINMFSMIVYSFGIFYNFIKDQYVFPLIIIYPALQLFNFSILILEKFSIFDKFLIGKYKNKFNVLLGRK